MLNTASRDPHDRGAANRPIRLVLSSVAPGSIKTRRDRNRHVELAIGRLATLSSTLQRLLFDEILTTWRLTALVHRRAGDVSPSS